MGKSSKDKRDAYYRLAKEQGWRARSAFKLLQLDEAFDLFTGVTRVVDLCAAPGSWSQVLSRVLIQGERVGRAAWEDRRHAAALALASSSPSPSSPPNDPLPTSTPSPPPPPRDGARTDVRIVAIDLQPMSPLEGIVTLKADITHPSTVPLLLRALDPPSPSDSVLSGEGGGDASHPVDLVLSDGAPDVTGLHDLDVYVQAQLLHAALGLAVRVLRPGGRFVAKVFRAGDVDVLYAQLREVFDRVTVAKPRSSRASSVEAFVVCEGFRGMGGKGDGGKGGDGGERRVRDDGVTEVRFGEDEEEGEEAGSRWIAPFLACGDLSSFDADASHRLPEGHVSLDPVQPPTAPPYRKALEERRKMGGAYGKTKLGSVG